jgi:two-component system phosphate regulon response regulator PhoB
MRAAALAEKIESNEDSVQARSEQSARVVVIEDEHDIRELIEYNLRRRGMIVFGAGTGEEGLELIERLNPNLVLLDLMLPDIAGLRICERLRREPRTAQIPIIIISARGEEADVVAGLEQGADDYITKPFSPKVLLARANAVIRRRERSEEP